MADTAELRAALAEAVAESDFPTSDDEAAKSWDDWDNEGGALAPDESAPAADDEAKPGTGDAPVVDSTPEVEETQELPDEYWGVPLDGIPDEAKQAIIDHFAQQDSTIQKLQARLATEPAAPAPTNDTPAAAEEVTDEALLQALGFDPEDWETQQLAPRILPLARTVIDLEDKVEALVQKDTVNTVRTQWNGQLDELESVQGKLPFSREQVLRYAIEENIASPFEVYFRLSAPVKREVEQTVAKARREAAKKAEAGGTKPRTSSGDSSVIDPKTTSLRDAVKIAMMEAEKETGASWKSIFGKKVFTEKT